MLDFVKEKKDSRTQQKAQRKFRVLINEASSGAQDYGRQSMEESIFDILGIEEENLCFFTPDSPDKAYDFLKKNNDCPLLIGGGDGTILAMAEHFLKQKIKRPFGVLPLGTMNLFARSINVALTLESALKAYGQASHSKADIIEVNGHFFLCAAALGLIPTLSEIREEHREEGLLGAMPEMSEKALGNVEDEDRHFEVSYNDKRHSVQATNIVISNHCYTKDDNHNLIDGFNGQGHDDGTMYSYTLHPSGLADQLRFLAKLSFGSWLDDPSIEKINYRKGVTIQTENDIEKVALDGEVYNIKTPLHFKMHQKALDILVPHINSKKQ